MKLEFTEKNEQLLYALLGVLVALVFITDLLVPLGTAVWIIYLVPVIATYLAPRPRVPLIVAIVVTALVTLGFLADRSGIDPNIARLNRIMGVATVWVIAATGYYFVRNKLSIQRQNWLQTGQVGLGRRINGELGPDTLSDQALSYLVEYLGARAGAIFVRDGDRYVRMAAYGVPADAPVPREFVDGDGLLGRAVSENRSFIVDQLPEDYFYFGSGLGRAKPSGVLIVPTRADNGVNGVMEFGFSGKLPATHPELLERISAAIGLSLRSAQYRTRLQELLEETRKQAEALRGHTEELSAANEELEEQSRSLQESQKRLELQQSELEQTNAQLEEQTQLLETQRDDLARTRTDLEKHAGQLQVANRYKSEFVANMSHELRTPLNALLIMARLLADNRTGNLSEEEVSFAQTIENSGNDLLALINDILDISKIEAGKLDMQAETVSVSDIADKLVRTFEPLGQQKGLSVRAEIAPEVPPAFSTDPLRLEQVLKNFLSNAIKFTERGEVVLDIRPAPDGRLAFSVRDTGIGIPADQQQVIFEAFRQADGTINRKYGGTGLGLSISRELALLLNGEIEVTSAQGEGSIFTLFVPLVLDTGRFAGPRRITASSPHAVPQIEPPAPQRPARPTVKVDDDRDSLKAGGRLILVVEDDKAFSRILYDLAHELGFQCIIAATADEGVIAARQYLPHAVVLDIGLPDHTGLSVLDRLKHDARTRHIPVHVASVEDYTQMALSYGASSYMLKPVKREQLVHALESLETRLSQNMRRILIVEDDRAQLEGLRQLLASKDVETVGSSTAADALSRLKVETFDCMVLDMTLPDASGFDVLDQLNADDRFSFPPVIVYTARELTDDEELRLRRYSKSIIIKGAKSPERLIDEVTLFLHQVVSDLPERQQQLLANALNRDATLEGRRILIVEDDVRNVFAVTSIFEPHGAIVQIARNGREALEALDRAAVKAAPHIDLVLMDVMMPEMDGLTATRQIRQREPWKALPIIMLTAKAMADDQAECLAAGANDYLAKPLDVDKLLSLTRVWMPR